MVKNNYVFYNIIRIEWIFDYTRICHDLLVMWDSGWIQASKCNNIYGLRDGSSAHKHTVKYAVYKTNYLLDRGT